MEQKKFEAMLVLIVPKIIDLIVQNHAVDEVTASKAFYESKVIFWCIASNSINRQKS